MPIVQARGGLRTALSYCWVALPLSVPALAPAVASEGFRAFVGDRVGEE